MMGITYLTQKNSFFSTKVQQRMKKINDKLKKQNSTFFITHENLL